MSKPKILVDIENLKKNQLTGQYYIPSVTRETSSPTTLTANPLPTTWTGSGTSYANGNYRIETSMAPSGANPFSNAFDGNDSNQYIGLATTSAENYIIITLPEALSVASFNTFIPDAVGLDQCMIQGSSNKSTWTTLYTYSSLDTALTTRIISSSQSYKYYRFLFTLDSNASITVREIKLGTYTVTTASNKFVLDSIHNPLSVNQRIMIKTPSYSATGVTSNTFNGKSIDVVLQPLRYYELVYDGTKYLAKEVV